MENLIMTNMNVDDLASKICELVSNKIFEHNETDLKKKNKEKIYLTIKQVTAKYDISSVTIWKMRKDGKIPFIRAGKRRILFDAEALDLALCSNKINTSEN
jgi:excisionase family DNA binding protein